MRLTILGGSAAGANPGQGCSGYLVDSDGTNVVLDLGPGTLTELRRHADFRTLDAVVLSHLHLDHLLDVLALRYALAYNPKPPGARIPLWVPPGGAAFLSRIASSLSEPPTSAEFLAVFAIHEYDPGVQLVVGKLAISFHPTFHYVPCWAMRVSNGHDGDLVYTADTGPAANLAPFAREAHVVLAEGAAIDDGLEDLMSRGHLTPTEAGALARESGARLLVLTHLWVESNPQVALELARTAFGGSALLAIPGLRISWSPELIETTEPRC